MNPRKWEMWNADVFTGDQTGYADSFDIWFPRVAISFIGLVAFGLPGLASLGSGAVVIGLMLLAVPVLVMSSFGWGRYVYKYRNVPNLPGYSHNPRHVARRYDRLSKQDKRNFHSNIMEVLTNPDISNVQKRTIAEHMQRTMDAITERERARAAALERHVDISSVLDYMEDQRNGLRAETEQYKELS